jgi:uncharacterized membrane protein YjgN (DUF898 family)
MQKLTFHGTGGKLFAIQIVNILLTIVTLGLYYPWAKAASMRYVMGETEFAESRFAFLGTGNEMFRGFIVGILIVGVVYGSFFGLAYLGYPIVGFLILVAALIFLVPFAIHSSMRYRTSRTTWRGIHFGYRGDLKELFAISLKGTLLTVVTFGIYGAWYAMDLRSYVLSHVRMGSVELRYKGNGGDYLWMNMAGYFLSIITLGIYSFWWMRDMFNYYVNNLWLVQGDHVVRLKSKATGGGFFGLFALNFFLIILTLGLATPWVIVRTLHFTFENVEFLGELDLDNIQQTEADYKNATGDDLSSMLDVGMV